MRSRVMPGSLVTMERRVPVRRLNSVDVPTLGRPTITMEGSLEVISVAQHAWEASTVSRQREFPARALSHRRHQHSSRVHIFAVFLDDRRMNGDQLFVLEHKIERSIP